MYKCSLFIVIAGNSLDICTIEFDNETMQILTQTHTQGNNQRRSTTKTEKREIGRNLRLYFPFNHLTNLYFILSLYGPGCFSSLHQLGRRFMQTSQLQVMFFCIEHYFSFVPPSLFFQNASISFSICHL